MATRNIKFTIRNDAISPAYLAQFREIFDDITYLKPREYKEISRYKNVRTIQDPDTAKIYHETVNPYSVEKAEKESTYIVGIETENRLDLISYRCYSTPKYWWVVALANNIIDPFDVPYGTVLRIPPLSQLYNDGGILYG